MIFHITKKQRWIEAKEVGEYKTETLSVDGFIHFSGKHQVVAVANFLYSGERNMVLLCVDEYKIKPKLVFEDLKGNGVFPHLYGPLNVEAVVKVVDFPVDEDGKFRLPSLVEKTEKGYSPKII